MTTATQLFYRAVGRASLGFSPPNRDTKLVWYAVAAIVLFALGATIVLGAIIYCDLHGKDFGAVRPKTSKTWLVGCH